MFPWLRRPMWVRRPAYVADAARIARHLAGGYVRLLYVVPSRPVEAQPVDDELTAAMEAAFARGLRTQTFRGWHVCVCGARSGNCDWEVGGRFETNSLCVHYLRWHRAEIPEADLAAVRELAAGQGYS